MPLMQKNGLSPWCISFTFANVPTVIHPSSWIVLLLLGSMVNGSGGTNLFQVILFAVAGMLCLLVHEYGHAFVCRALGGGKSVVHIGSMGGMTQSEYPPPTRLGHIAMVLAGPGASLLLGLTGGVALGLMMKNIGAGLIFSLLSPLTPDLLLSEPWMVVHVTAPLQDMLESGQMPPYVFYALLMLFSVCTWWSLFNLLPIFPLDGGQTLRLITRSNYLTARVGVTIAALLLVFFLVNLMFLLALMAAYFVYLNWQYLKSSRE